MFIHKTINEPRLITLGWCLHELVKQLPLIIRFVFLIDLIDKRKASDVLAYLLTGETNYVPINMLKLAFGAFVAVRIERKPTLFLVFLLIRVVHVDFVMH